MSFSSKSDAKQFPGAIWVVTPMALDDVQITSPTDHQIVATMTDGAQVAGWCTFHARHARLQLLSPRGNLSGAKRGA